MEPTEHGDCMDAAVRLEWTWNRLLVPEGLVRTRLVVVADVLGDDAPEVIVTEDEEVVEHLSPERANEALSKSIQVRRAYRRAHDAHTRRPEYVSEARAELRVVVADDNLWRAVHCGVPGLLRAPPVGWRVRHRGMEDRSATQVQEESTNTSRNRMSNVCAKSQAHVTWFLRNVDQLCPSPRGRVRRMYR